MVDWQKDGLLEKPRDFEIASIHHGTHFENERMIFPDFDCIL